MNFPHDLPRNDVQLGFGLNTRRLAPIAHTGEFASPERMGVGQGQQVAILLATLNGERFLGEQLDSYASQTHSNWRLWVSDDGSTDKTLDILRTYQSKWGDERIEIRSGPQQGFAKNFMSLASDPQIEADYYAFSDQDDIWRVEKIQRAVAWLSDVSASVPALYCSRTELVDAFGNHIGYSPLFQKPPSFRNSLVQNIAAGNTIVFNQASKKLIHKLKLDFPLISHDWLFYIIITGAGGILHYDAFPSVLYRQHDKNLVGANSSPYAKLRRGYRLMRGEFKNWLDVNSKMLEDNNQLLTLHNRVNYQRFAGLRKKTGINRAISLSKMGFSRQSKFDDITLKGAAIFHLL